VNMSCSPLLLLDASASLPCEHVSSLQRWLSAVLPDFRPHCHSTPERVENFSDGVKAVLLHGSPGDVLDRLRRRIEQKFRGARIFSVSHRAAELTRECIPLDTLDNLCAVLAPWLGANRPFEVLPGVTGCAPSLCKAAGHVLLMAQSDATCLLQGETGTGKELFARAIHYLGQRKHRPFVPVNCGAIPDSLFENEMFGHVRGAYTDARNSQLGLLAHASSGTLFLDEVDCLSASAQVKLLRVLQEHEYRPVGSSRSISTDVRVIAATNSDLRKRVQQHLFREDLFHRLNVLRLPIPPLRERPGDMALLARTFVRDFARRYKRPEPRITDEAYRALEAYDWPGNVREMEAVFERAVLLSSAAVITAEDLEIPVTLNSPAQPINMRSAKNRVIMHFERAYLSDLLSRCTGNISHAARIAGKERRSFQRLLRKHNLTGTDFRSA
jgi:two-component system, NtrC family, response regulator GlrR